ncbi:UDP-2,3-diacylglucosamine diphosphatase [soil metagenome]
MSLGERYAAVTLPAGSRVWIVSDLHLWSDRPATLARFEATLVDAVANAEALFILGDLFEYWAGDDDAGSDDVRPIVAAMSRASSAGLALYVMHGNRDFLLGDAFAEAAGCRLLADECLLTVGDRSVLLMHGDSLCTDDLDYQAFRQRVRDPGYQAAFLAQPLEQRHAVIAQMRAASEGKKVQAAAEIMDVNADAVDQVFARHAVDTLIHGHTHRPERHVLDLTRERWVLPDWEYEGGDERGGALLFVDGDLRPTWTATRPSD